MNYPCFFARNFRHNILLRKAAGRRVRSEGFNLDPAAIAFQLGLQILLQWHKGLRSGGTRAEADLFGDMSKSALAIEAAGSLRRRGVIGVLRRSRSYRAHEGRVSGGNARERSFRDGRARDEQPPGFVS